jgi:glycosyltransferase involved in cell wall biosynthesis
MDDIRSPSRPKNRYGKWMNEECVPGLVSVIIPTYNCAHFLIEAMNSVLAQTYRPIELIVVDDGSTDNTREVVEGWKQKHPRDNAFELRYFDQENKGGPAARNVGLVESQGEYIQFLDADDVLSPSKLSCQVIALSSCGCQTAAYGPWRHFEKVGEKMAMYEPYGSVEGNDLLKKWIDGSFVVSHSLLWKRADLIKLGAWDESLAADQDGEYAMRFLAYGGNLIYCDQAWVYYRQSPNFLRAGNHVSRWKTSKSIRSRIRVTRRLERILSIRGLLNDEYRAALSRRYYNIAKDFTIGHKTLRQLCLRHFQKLSPDGLAPGTLRHRLLTRLFGFFLTQKLRLFICGVLGLRVHLPVASVETIEELKTFDERTFTR